MAFVNDSLKELERSETSYLDIQKKHKILKMMPFNSETKKMTVVVEVEPEKRVRIYTKGASENIIDDCAFILVDPKQQNSGGLIGG